jgi:SAM-dependent methyltransferase
MKLAVRLQERLRLARAVARARVRRTARPARLGSLRGTKPLSDVWGRDRGTPIDRYYIQRFLEEHRHDIRGRTLEVMNSDYTRDFGTQVTAADVVDIDASNPAATIVTDLAAADAIPAETFDCFILTQTLQFIYDVPAVVFHAHRILAPGGTILCTVPSVSRISRGRADREFWRFTAASCRSLFGEEFPDGAVEVTSFGNVLPAIAFLAGLAAEELSREELDSVDEHFPVVVAVRAVKAGKASS